MAKLANWKKFKINYVTNTVEPDPSWVMKWPRYFCSVSVVFLLVMLDVAAVLGIVLYRISVMAALAVHGDQASTITMVTSSFINLFLIYLMSYVRTFCQINTTICQIIK